MERGGSAVRRPGLAWWAWWRVPGLAAGLLLVERELVRLAGMPNALLRTLQLAGRAPADPVAPVIALLAVMAEGLVGYVLALLVLRSLSLLPGSIGQLTGRVVLLAGPRTLHRLLDLLVGGALLAQATLATMPGSSLGGGPRAVRQLTVPASPVAGTAPVEARPTPSRLAAPLPPWLGGGPSNAATRYTVEQGDTLWGIAASHLAPADRSLPKVHRYWRRIYRANRPVIGADPDRIHPGTRLDVPPFGTVRRP
jgi:hypothetical protein